MYRLAFSRARAIVLLIAFSLTLAGQAVAGLTMAAQMSSSAGEPVAVLSGVAMGGCSECNGRHAAISPTCAIVFCWGFVAVSAQCVLPERMSSQGFGLVRYDTSPGIRLRPDPHPPRALLSA